jgi:hypothetical protein
MSGKGICSVLFPPNVLMVLSSVFVATIGGEHLSCDDFSISQTIRFGNLEFIGDRFGSLSLSPLGDGLGIIVMGLTYDGPLHLQ